MSKLFSPPGGRNYMKYSIGFRELTSLLNDKQTDIHSDNAALRKENKRLQKENERQKKALAINDCFYLFNLINKGYMLIKECWRQTLYFGSILL
jgi:hypothetical protein